MKKYYYTIITILFFGLFSCSNEETKTQNQIVARPTLPITASEVRIGTQVWMTKNLNVSRYRNGDPIPQVTDPTQLASLTTGAWCYYNNDQTKGPIYGKLYNWYAVNDPRGLAPTGWHVANDAEWTTLTDYLGGESVAGAKMKATGTIAAGTGTWYTPNLGATNSSGFTALPGGSVSYDGSFRLIGVIGSWWSSSERDTALAWQRMIQYNFTDVSKTAYYKTSGFSVRCLRD